MGPYTKSSEYKNICDTSQVLNKYLLNVAQPQKLNCLSSQVLMQMYLAPLTETLFSLQG